jgi:hypothetical protein
VFLVSTRSRQGVNVDKKDYDPARMAILRSLPREIKESLTQEEVDAFLRDEELPDSLAEKLKDYLEDV